MTETFSWGTYAGPEGTRRYKLFVPSTVSSNKRRMIVMLHGCTQDPDDLARGTRMNEIAGKEGFLVLYPEQPVTANPLKCWNWFAAAHQGRDAGEPAILAALIRQVIADQKVDRSKVYLAGISAGGAMAAIMGATYPEMFSAVAMHSGIAYRVATDMSMALAAMRGPPADTSMLGKAVVDAMGDRRKPMPSMILQGSKDPSVAPGNATLLAQQWRVANGIADSIAPHRMDQAGHYPVQQSSWRVKGKPVVELWMIEGLAHAWSGGAKEGTYTDEKGPNASEAIVGFFVTQARKRK